MYKCAAFGESAVLSVPRNCIIGSHEVRKYRLLITLTQNVKLNLNLNILEASSLLGCYSLSTV